MSYPKGLGRFYPNINIFGFVKETVTLCFILSMYCKYLDDLDGENIDTNPVKLNKTSISFVDILDLDGISLDHLPEGEKLKTQFSN